MGLKKLFAAKDMTQGAPWQRILEFSIPMLLGNVAQQLYNTADSVIVGMFVGDNALAAVGSAMPILNLLLALFVGIATGAGIVISQAYGARDRDGLSRSIGNCITLAGVASVVIMVVGPLLTRPMLVLLGTPDSILGWCTSYLVIQFVGIAGFFFYNMLSGVLRGLGDSVSALGFLLLAAALNVVLDLLFVAGFDMGVAGVSLATVIAQTISALFCFRKLMKMRAIFDLNKQTVRLDQNVAMRIIRLGVPSGITQAIFSMSAIIVQSLTNTLGDAMVAANTAIMRVDGFAMMPNFTFGTAATTYIGQNVGAGRGDRLKPGLKAMLLLGLISSTVLVAAILLFGHNIIGWFTETELTIQLGVQGLQTLAFGYICFSVTQVLQGSMRGAGETKLPMYISIIGTVILRMPLAYLMAALTKNETWPNGQPIALFGSLLIAWVVSMMMTVVSYRMKFWRKKLGTLGDEI